jgi:hypothetical protein
MGCRKVHVDQKAFSLKDRARELLQRGGRAALKTAETPKR